MNNDIDGVNIPFDPNWNRIAISLSGGADSALLAYLLCRIASEQNPKLKIYIISHIRLWKTKPWQQYDSLSVYNYLLNKFPHFIWERYTNLIAPDVEYANMGPNIKDEYGKMVSGDNAQIRAFSEYICYYNKIDAYYNAVTKNPKNVDFEGMVERDIEKNENNSHLELMQHMGIWASHPFRFVEKDWILKQYRNNNIMDLFELTRSCEGEVEGINYISYKPYQSVPVCNDCFWCKERAWAIEKSK